MEELMFYFKLLTGRKCSADELNYEVPESIARKEMNTEKNSYVQYFLKLLTRKKWC
jgi:hypothetical protein